MRLRCPRVGFFHAWFLKDKKYGQHQFYDGLIKYLLNKDFDFRLFVRKTDFEDYRIIITKDFEKVKKEIRNLDILHAIGTPVMTVKAIHLARKLNKPVLLGPNVLPLVPHLLDFKKYRDYRDIFKMHGLLESISYFLVGMLIARLSDNFPYLIFDSKIHRDMIQPYGVNVKYTIDIGVEPNIFKPLDTEKENIALFVGNVVSFKGIEDFLKAMKLLKNYEIKGYVLGSGDIERYQKIAPSNVEFKGKVPRRDLPKFYNKAKVTVVPSYFETFSYVAFESLFCGTPVIVRDTLSHLLNKAPPKCISSFSNAHELAENIKEVIKNSPPKPNKIHRYMSDKYSWQKIWDRLIVIYHDVIENH